MTAIRRDDDSTTLTVSNTDAILFRLGLRVAPVFSVVLLGIMGWYLARQEKDHDTLVDLKPRVTYIEKRMGIAWAPAPNATKSFLTISDVALALGVDSETITRYIKQEILFPPPRKVNGRWIFDEPPTLLCGKPKEQQTASNQTDE